MFRTAAMKTVAFALMGALAGSVVYGTMLFTRTQDRDRLQDGSCVVAARARTKTRTRTESRFRLLDGTGGVAIDPLRTRDRDRLRDGSCDAA